MSVKDTKVDYAPHHIIIENHLKLVHDLLKCNNYKDAAATAEQMMVECRLLRNAIRSYDKH
jgi:hypothetical protein